MDCHDSVNWDIFVNDIKAKIAELEAKESDGIPREIIHELI